MLVKCGEPHLDTKKLGPLWKSHIANLSVLKECMLGSVLVALDIESSSEEDVSEIGLAILPVDGVAPQFYHGLRTFYHQNQVQVTTVEVYERISKYGPPEKRRYGNVISSSAEAAGPTVKELLSAYKGRVILTGFDLYAEFKWISRKFPSLSSSFAAWVDVQDLISEGRGNPRRGLSDTLKAMQIIDWRSNTRRHFAANDALRCLIVLSGLVSGVPLHDPTISSSSKVLFLTYLPTHTKNHHFTTRGYNSRRKQTPFRIPNTSLYIRTFHEVPSEGCWAQLPDRKCQIRWCEILVAVIS
jgi:hypothetical protein